MNEKKEAVKNKYPLTWDEIMTHPPTLKKGQKGLFSNGCFFCHAFCPNAMQHIAFLFLDELIFKGKNKKSKSCSDPQSKKTRQKKTARLHRIILACRNTGRSGK
jgi:hypothetical protein